MQTIELETTINAPPERCFLLSLSIDLHLASASSSGERAVAGTTTGLIGPGETVTWRGRHFGLWLTHQTLITTYDKPRHFQDVMVAGLFRSFEHDHFFVQQGDGTLMRDVLQFSAPLGLLGALAERAVLRRHLTGFLMERNRVIKRVAEDQDDSWKLFV